MPTRTCLHVGKFFRKYSLRAHRGARANLEGIPIHPDYDDFSLIPPKHYSQPSGNFTKYGDVLELIGEGDDEFVIMHHGDEITIHFDSPPIDPIMERDYLLYTDGYYKGDNFPTGDTVEPLPYHEMSSYPYPENEEYPFHEHAEYITEYNTRVYDGVTSDSVEHHTIYTDYVMVEVFYEAVGGELLSAKTMSALTFSFIIIALALGSTIGIFKSKKLR